MARLPLEAQPEDIEYLSTIFGAINVPHSPIEVAGAVQCLTEVSEHIANYVASDMCGVNPDASLGEALATPGYPELLEAAGRGALMGLWLGYLLGFEEQTASGQEQQLGIYG
jgi:hypothetical protein